MQNSLESKFEPAVPGYATLALCFLVVLMDGFDTQTIGFNAVAIARDSGIPIAAFGPVFAAGLLGAALGAWCLGPVGDRYGRWPILRASVALFAVFSFALPAMKTLDQLLICRLLTGAGLGGALPNLLALSAQQVPRRLRGVVTGVLFAGIPAGGFVGAMLTARIAPTLGWPWVFYVGGALPLMMVVLMGGTLVRRREGWMPARRAAAAAGGRSEVAAQAAAAPTPTHAATRNMPLHQAVLQALQSIGGAPTALLWTVSLLCFVVLIDVALWSAPLLHHQGMPETTAALVVGAFNLGSVVGTACGGRLLDRYPAWVVLPGSFAGGAAAVCLLGLTGAGPLWPFVCACLAGAFIGSASAQLLALAVLLYPAALRATGVGGVVAVGRFGQVFAPLAVGLLLKQAVPVAHIYLVIAAPAALATGLALLLCRSKAVLRGVASAG
jgi:AAHS family 4-hydroxybenzoate transporter-like MFS transporter